MLPFAAAASFVDATWYTTSACGLVISLVTGGHTTLVPVVGDADEVAVILGVADAVGVTEVAGVGVNVGIGSAAGSGASAAFAVAAISPVVLRAIALAATAAISFA
ncbi:unannotated protein [freshwater metagenome]|uniref:Unannotated protein n=1 Tax=freshwater metagenome TaxID=449393 RepID=A0A6J6J8S8_9ZZZZ